MKSKCTGFKSRKETWSADAAPVGGRGDAESNPKQKTNSLLPHCQAPRPWSASPGSRQCCVSGPRLRWSVVEGLSAQCLCPSVIPGPTHPPPSGIRGICLCVLRIYPRSWCCALRGRHAQSRYFFRSCFHCPCLHCPCFRRSCFRCSVVSAHHPNPESRGLHHT